MRIPKAVAVLTMAMLGVSCGEGLLEPDQSNDRIDITNDSQALESRVLHPDSPLEIDPSSLAPGASPPAAEAIIAASQALRLWLITEVSPPIVDGEVVQATSVAIERSQNKVMVSYNMRGARRLGAIDWITRLLPRPRISASATFNDSDISALSFDGTHVYAAEATDAAGFPFPAVLERLKLTGDKFTLEDNVRIPLSSFAATSILRAGRAIYATSGDGGDVFAFDERSLEQLGRFPLDDARWVARDEDGNRVAVVQGTPGRISVFAEGEFPGGSMNLLDTFSFPGADVPESKSTVEVVGGKAFIAAGPEGVQIVCLDDGQAVGSVPLPDPAALGLDPSVVVTNAVTVDEDVMFISNGEAGIYVARGSKNWEDTACDEQQQIAMLGRLRFTDLQSANHIDFKNRWLVVAAGLGGVKMVFVTGL